VLRLTYRPLERDLVGKAVTAVMLVQLLLCLQELVLTARIRKCQWNLAAGQHSHLLLVSFGFEEELTDQENRIPFYSLVSSPQILRSVAHNLPPPKDRTLSTDLGLESRSTEGFILSSPQSLTDLRLSLRLA
jgi:hypothetical protein